MPGPKLVDKDGNVYEQSEDGYYLDQYGNPVQADEDCYYVDEDGNRVDPADVSVGIGNEPWGVEDRLGPEFADIIEPGAADPSMAKEVDLSVIDWATVQGTNQAAVKALEVDDRLPFWQSGGYLLIGADHDQDWRHLIEKASGYAVYEDCDGTRYPTGTLVMTRKGRLNDPGKLTIYGSPDQQATLLAIGEWSQKKVEFG